MSKSTSSVTVPGTKAPATTPTIPQALIKGLKADWQAARKSSAETVKHMLSMGKRICDTDGKYTFASLSKATDIPGGSLSKAEKVYRVYVVRGKRSVDVLASLPTARADGSPMAKLYAWADKVDGHAKAMDSLVKEFGQRPTMPKGKGKTSNKGDKVKVTMDADTYARLLVLAENDSAPDLDTYLKALCDELESEAEQAA